MSLIEKYVSRDHSTYIFSHVRSASHKSGQAAEADKRFLESYKEKAVTLHEELKETKYYDASTYDFDFKAWIFAMDKVIAMLGYSHQEEEQLEIHILMTYIEEKYDTFYSAFNHE